MSPETIQVFVENERGSTIKHLHDEKRLQLTGTMPVSRPYPFPYGFVLNTTAPDGDNVDCFVLTRTTLCPGEIVECKSVALMEQIEDGLVDHKILAVLVNDARPLPHLPVSELSEFVTHVFDHIPGKVITVGEFRSREDAEQYLHQCADGGGGKEDSISARS